jgi:hypothetical protein
MQREDEGASVWHRAPELMRQQKERQAPKEESERLARIVSRMRDAQKPVKDERRRGDEEMPTRQTTVEKGAAKGRQRVR